MHPGPINRGREISSEVADSQRSVILNQVENGIAVRMAVLERILGANRHETKLLIKNGRVIDPASGLRRHRRCPDRGRAHGIGRRTQDLDAPSATCSMRRAYRGPGLHRHARAPARARLRACRDHRIGARAAAAGGFTTICRDAEHVAGERQRHRDQLHRGESARRYAIVNVFPIGAITKGSAGEELAAIGSMREAGHRGDFRRRTSGDERARHAPRHGVARALRPSRDQPLRGSEPQRRRRHARGRWNPCASGCAAFPAYLKTSWWRGTFCSPNSPARAFTSRIISSRTFGGDGRIREVPRLVRDLRSHAASFRAGRYGHARRTTATIK